MDSSPVRQACMILFFGNAHRRVILSHKFDRTQCCMVASCALVLLHAFQFRMVVTFGFVLHTFKNNLALYSCILIYVRSEVAFHVVMSTIVCCVPPSHSLMRFKFSRLFFINCLSSPAQPTRFSLVRGRLAPCPKRKRWHSSSNYRWRRNFVSELRGRSISWYRSRPTMHFIQHQTASSHTHVSTG